MTDTKTTPTAARDAEQITTDHPDVKSWIEGKHEVAHVENRFGELHIVSKCNGCYRIVRFFWLGGNVACSVDCAAQSPDQIISFLLEKLYSV